MAYAMTQRVFWQTQQMLLAYVDPLEAGDTDDPDEVTRVACTTTE